MRRHGELADKGTKAADDRREAPKGVVEWHCFFGLVCRVGRCLCWMQYELYHGVPCNTLCTNISLAGVALWEPPPHGDVVTARNEQPLGAHAFGAERNTQSVPHNFCMWVVAIKSVVTPEVASTEVLSSDAKDFGRLGVFDGEQTKVQSGAILKRPFAFDEESVRLTNQIRCETMKMTTSASFAQHQPVIETNVHFKHTVDNRQKPTQLLEQSSRPCTFVLLHLLISSEAAFFMMSNLLSNWAPTPCASARELAPFFHR